MIQSAEGQEIVAGLRAGDREAMRRAYECHKADVLAVAATLVGSHAAWDVLHDVFVSLARTAPGLDRETDLRAYLVCAAANKARDRLSQAFVRKTRASLLLDDLSSQSIDPSIAVGDDEQAILLWRAVTQLPEDQKTVVSLRIYGDLTFARIAESLGISENTAQSRYRYALEKLRRLVRREA